MPGGPELLIISLILILPAVGIIDAAMRPDPAWQRAGQSKIVWVLVQIFLTTIGTIVYFVAIRPRVKAAQNEVA